MLPVLWAHRLLVDTGPDRASTRGLMSLGAFPVTHKSLIHKTSHAVTASTRRPTETAIMQNHKIQPLCEKDITCQNASY